MLVKPLFEVGWDIFFEAENFPVSAIFYFLLSISLSFQVWNFIWSLEESVKKLFPIHLAHIEIARIDVKVLKLHKFRCLWKSIIFFRT